MCDLDFDGGRLDFAARTRPVARKPRRCDICRKPILPGTRYVRESYKWEGEVGVSAACLRCEIDVMAFAKAHDGSRPLADSFIDFLVGCLDDHDEESERVWRPMLERIEARQVAHARTFQQQALDRLGDAP